MVCGCILAGSYDGEDSRLKYGLLMLYIARGLFLALGLFILTSLSLYISALSDCAGKVLGLTELEYVSIIVIIDAIFGPIFFLTVGDALSYSSKKNYVLFFVLLLLSTSAIATGALSIPVETDRVDPNDPDQFLEAPLVSDEAGVVILSICLLFNLLGFELLGLVLAGYALHFVPDRYSRKLLRTDAYALTYIGQTLFLIAVVAVSVFASMTAFVQTTFIMFCGFFLILFLVVSGWRNIRSESIPDNRQKESACSFGESKRALQRFFWEGNEYRQARKFLLSWMFVAPVTVTSLPIMTLHFQQYLGFSALTVQLAIGLSIVVAGLATIGFGKLLQNRRVRLKLLYVTTTAFYAGLYFISPVLLYSERTALNESSSFSQFGRCDTTANQEVFFVVSSDASVLSSGLILTVLNAVCLGIIYAANFYSALIPMDQNTELYIGIKLIAGSILLWLPSIGYGALANSGGDARNGPLFLGILLTIGALLGCWVDVEEGKVQEEDGFSLKEVAYD